MTGSKCNSTLEYELVDEVLMYKSMTFHQIALVISAVFACWAIAVSLYLIFRHATHYSRPDEQRHIIRILFMVPIYATVSFLSFYFYRHAIYYQVLRDCYEAFAISSFFTLLCTYLAPDLHHQKEYFRGIKPKGWIWPLSWLQKCSGGERGMWRTPRSGLTWFNVIWAGVFQYCLARVCMTLVAVITQAAGVYCQESYSPEFANIWVVSIECISVCIAMYCLIQFFYQVRKNLGDHSPMIKIVSIKLVIFLSFWQSVLLSLLSSFSAIKATKKVQEPDILVGIPSMLLCIEMAIFSVLHLWAFSWKPYEITSSLTFGQPIKLSYSYHGGPLGMKAIGAAFNPWDLVKAIGRSARWIFVGRTRRMEDSSYESHHKWETGSDVHLVESITQSSGTATVYDDATKTTTIRQHEVALSPGDEGWRAHQPTRPSAASSLADRAPNFGSKEFTTSAPASLSRDTLPTLPPHAYLGGTEVEYRKLGGV